MTQVVPSNVPPERLQEQELAARLRAMRQDSPMVDFKLLLDLRLKRLDKELRRCPSTDVAAKQGQAALIEKLLEEIWMVPR